MSPLRSKVSSAPPHQIGVRVRRGNARKPLAQNWQIVSAGGSWRWDRHPAGQITCLSVAVLSLAQLQDKATVLTTERKKVSLPRAREELVSGGGGRLQGRGASLHPALTGPLVGGLSLLLREGRRCQRSW